MILNLDQWIRCCVKSSIFSFGDYFVQQGRSGCVVLVEGLTGNVITNCMEVLQFGPVVQEMLLDYFLL